MNVRMISGPKVDIYVGTERKHYSLPKRLLCHYSAYFDRCFNDEFVEAKLQTLELVDDYVDWFEVLAEFMITGSVSHATVEKVCLDSGNNGPSFNNIISFIQYAENYGLGEASSDVVLNPLKQAYARYGFFDSYEHIQIIFRAVPKGNPLRGVVAQAYLPTLFLLGHIDKGIKYEETVVGFASEVLDQLWKGENNVAWYDPIAKVTRNRK